MLYITFFPIINKTYHSTWIWVSDGEPNPGVNVQYPAVREFELEKWNAS